MQKEFDKVWKNGQRKPRFFLGDCFGFIGDCGGNSEITVLIGMQTLKPTFMKFQMGIRQKTILVLSIENFICILRFHEGDSI